MATVTLTPDVMTEAGVAPTRTSGLSTGNTYKFRNNGKMFLHFRKTGAGACTVTIATSGSIRGHAAASQAVTVPATTGDIMVGPLARDLYNDTNNDVSFTLSEVTGLDVAAVQL